MKKTLMFGVLLLVLVAFTEHIEMGKALSENKTQLSYNPVHLKQWLETGSCFNCNLRGVNLSGQKVLSRFVKQEEISSKSKPPFNKDFTEEGTGMNLSGSDLSGADLSNVDLSGANFGLAKLVGTNFRGAKLHYVQLASADIQNADFTNANMKYVQISYTRNVPSAKLARKWVLIWELFHVGASGRDLSNEDFSYAIFKPTPPHSTSRLFPDFSGSNLKNASFKGAMLTECNFNGADLQGADLSEAKIEATSFWKADLRRASFKETIGVGFNFSDADLRDSNFEGFAGGMKIQGAKLEGVKCGGMTTGENCFLSKQIFIDKEN